MRSAWDRVSIAAASAIYIGVLHYAYGSVICTTFAYQGYEKHFSALRILLACSLAFLPSLGLPLGLRRPSQVAYWLLYLLVIVPISIVPIYTANDDHLPMGQVICTVGAFMLLRLFYCIPLFPIRRFHLETHQFMFCSILFSLVLYALIVQAFGLQIQLLSLADIYSRRAQYEDVLAKAGVPLTYIVNWLSYVINPYFIIQGLVTKRLWLTGTAILGQFFIYTITGFRTLLFSPLLIGVLWWVFRRSRERFGAKLLLLFTVMIGSSMIVYIKWNIIEPFAIFVDRFILLPGLVSSYFFDFFSAHPQVHLAHSVLRWFLRYPYGHEPSYLIGRVYFHSTAMGANANVWADAYANFGYVGIFAFTGILGVTLWLYDSVSAKADYRLSAIMFAMPTVALANSALLTTILTHGIFLSILVMYLAPVRPRAWLGVTSARRYESGLGNKSPEAQSG
jgi:hypothetical protein